MRNHRVIVRTPGREELKKLPCKTPAGEATVIVSRKGEDRRETNMEMEGNPDLEARKEEGVRAETRGGTKQGERHHEKRQIQEGSDRQASRSVLQPERERPGQG